MAILKGSEPIKDIAKGSGSLSGVYLGESLVWPAWKPGVNTIAYYPFKTDVKDYSGNGYNGTISGAGYIETTNGLSYLHLNQGYVTSGVPYASLNSEVTISLWGNVDVINNPEPQFFGIGSRYNSKMLRLFAGNNGQGLLIFTIYGNDLNGVNITAGNWYHIVATTSTNIATLYLNGTSIGSKSMHQSLDTNNFRIGDNLMGVGSKEKISEFIVENKARTAQEVADYYNSTKLNYGL